MWYDITTFIEPIKQSRFVCVSGLYAYYMHDMVDRELLITLQSLGGSLVIVIFQLFL